jgi:hypothetical protein
MPQLRPLLRRLHSSLPESVRCQVDISSVSLRDILQNWYLPAYRVCAPLPHGKGEGTILYLGNKPQYSSWTHKLFGHAVEPAFVGQFSLTQILRGNHPDLSADVTLCPVNPLTSYVFRRKWHIMPLFVDCLVDLRKPIGELITSKGAKDDLRIARRLGYEFQVPTDEAAIHEFFHQMLVPTVKARHEERAFLSQWQKIEHIYRNGVLISAHLEDQYVGAILLALENTETARIANIGWRNGEDQWLKKGIVAALYNQSFVWAQQNGYHFINLGSSNPFANDGPLNFKLKWGATLVAPELKVAQGQVEGAHAFVGVRFNLDSSAAQSFLSSTPLLEYSGGLLRAISWNAEIPPLFRRQFNSGLGWVNLADQDPGKQIA